jgi:hypothetical protein
MIHLDQQITKEILKVAHKLPSPKSVVADTSDDLDSHYACKVDELAFTFLKRIIQLSVILMQNAGIHFTICQCFAAEALEFFVKSDCIGYRHSYMLDHEDSDSNSDASSMDSDWTENDSTHESMEEEDEEESLDDENRDWSIFSFPSSEDEDEDEESGFIIDHFLALRVETPTFDALFAPIPRKEINVSNEVFRPYVQQIIQHLNWWGVDDEIPDITLDTFKRAMYAYVVAKLKE